MPSWGHSNVHGEQDATLQAQAVLLRCHADRWAMNEVGRHHLKWVWADTCVRDLPVRNTTANAVQSINSTFMLFAAFAQATPVTAAAAAAAAGDSSSRRQQQQETAAAGDSCAAPSNKQIQISTVPTVQHRTIGNRTLATSTIPHKSAS